MDKLFQKLRQSREMLQLTQSEIAEMSGVKQNDISRMENGKREFIPNQYISFLLSKGIDISSIYDNSRDRPMFRDSQQNVDYSSSQSSTNQPSQVLHIKETELVYDDPVRNRPGSIPFYESDAFAGPTLAFNDGVEVPSTYIYSPGFEDCNFACRASGNSMEDKIHSGDILACKEIANKDIISYGDMYLVVTAEYRLIKVIRKGKERGWIILRSYNKEYDDIDIKLDDVLSLFLIKGIISKTQI